MLRISCCDYEQQGKCAKRTAIASHFKKARQSIELNSRLNSWIATLALWLACNDK